MEARTPGMGAVGMGTIRPAKGPRAWEHFAAVAVVVVPFGAVALYAFYILATDGERLESWDSFVLGQSTAVLVVELNKEPEAVLAYGRWDIWYVTSRKHENRESDYLNAFDPSLGPTHIPEAYDCFQFIVDRDTDRVVAKTWNGETFTIETVVGDFKGSSVDRLPAEAWDALAMWCDEEAVSP